MYISRSLSVAAAAVATLAAVAAGAPAPAASYGSGSGSPPGRALDWAPCPGHADVQCATLTLPIDRSDPDGPAFPLAVARHPATDPARRAGTLIFGPGGPGDSGVQRLETGLGRFSAEQRARLDIVSFDPRGVGGSSRIACPAPADPPPVILTSQADFDRTVETNRTMWTACRGQVGPIFDHVDTLSTVRDLDALRAALGEPALTFQGTSYGTLLGEQYAERYPDRVRAIVLESVDDHEPASTASFLSAQAWAGQDTFDAFVDWCAADQTCELHGKDVRAIFAGLRARATAGTLGLTPFQLNTWVLGLTKGPAFAMLAHRLREWTDGVTPPLPPALVVVTPTFCADWSLPIRDYRQYAAIMRQSARVAPDLRFPAQAMALTMCLGWPRPVANPQRRLSVYTAIPLLLLNSRHDPATGLNWAKAVQRQLGPHGVLVTYEGTGHGAYTQSDCMRAVADRYLIDLTVPPRGTTCPAESPA